MTKSLYFVSVCALLLNGCATISSGRTDIVQLTSTPNAEIAIKDEDGAAVYQGTTPTSVTLERGNGFFNGQTYQIDFTKPGYQNQTHALETHLNGAYFGNLLIGGLVGMLIVDPATGAMWDLPESVDVNLTPTATGDPLSNLETENKTTSAP